MNKVLWIYLFLYNVYSTSWAIGQLREELSFRIFNVLLLWIVVSVFSFRPFKTKNLFHLALLLTTSMVASAMMMYIDSVQNIKVTGSVAAGLLIAFSIILLPISILKRENSLNKKDWLIMPSSLLLLGLCFWSKGLVDVNSYFMVSLELGCTIAFFYSLLQNVIGIIKKCW